jgi:hypothetical protein
MSTIARERFERLDNNDSTLAVDGLSEFFPPQTGLEVDSALTFGDLFTQQSAAEDDDEDFEPEQLVQSDEVFQSEIQRAAVDFQRFADKFHAFASECQQRATVRHRLI